MSGQFINFEQTPLGRALKALVHRKNREIEFFAFSREGFPAVTALVSEVAEVFQAYDCNGTKERNFAKQAVGAVVNGKRFRNAVGIGGIGIVPPGFALGKWYKNWARRHILCWCSYAQRVLRGQTLVRPAAG